MRSKLMIFLILPAILLLMACGNKPAEADAYAPLFAEETGYAHNFSYTTIQATDEIQITIAYVTDELLARYDSVVEFSYRGRNPRTAGIAFIPNISVRNFRYIRINGTETEIVFIVEEDLFVLDKLLPETPFLADWAAVGSRAYGGFAFDDENGIKRYFGFNYCAAGLTAFRYMEFDGGL